MARIEWIEERLRNWARWRLMSGSGVLGFAGVNLENADMPREPYADAPIPTNEIEASEMEDLVKRLPGELKATVEVWYVDGGKLAKKLAKLCCAESTLHGRIERAHRQLADHLLAKQDRQKAERERVQAQMHGARP